MTRGNGVQTLPQATLYRGPGRGRKATDEGLAVGPWVTTHANNAADTAHRGEYAAGKAEGTWSW